MVIAYSKSPSYRLAISQLAYCFKWQGRREIKRYNLEIVRKEGGIGLEKAEEELLMDR